MDTPKIILEDKFTGHQKTHFILSIGSPFIITIYFLLQKNLNYKGYIALAIFIILYSLIICNAFTKRGFIKIKSKLYRGLFFRDRLIFKKQINLTNKTKMALFTLNISQKMAWFSIAKPDLAISAKVYEINLLNERHTKREALIQLKKKSNAEKAIQFLTSNFNLKKEIYNPGLRR